MRKSMRKPLLLLPALFVLLLGILLWHPWGPQGDTPATPGPAARVDPPPAGPSTADLPAPPPDAAEPLYTRGPTSKGGTGKYYMGREIATVLGHAGIDWLERPERETEEEPSKAVAALDLPPDAVIADIGSGSGYYSFRIAPLVPDGQVIAVDIQAEMLAALDARAEDQGIGNVATHLGTLQDTLLDPESIDAAIMVDAYHEFSHPREMMESIVEALRPGGRVFLIEYRAEDPAVMMLEPHEMSEAQARREMEAVGLEWTRTDAFLPMQHFMVFRKPAD
mgnify:CR=1 FL=1